MYAVIYGAVTLLICEMPKDNFHFLNHLFYLKVHVVIPLKQQENATYWRNELILVILWL